MAMPTDIGIVDTMIDFPHNEDPVAVTLADMDRSGIERGLVSVGTLDSRGEAAIKRYPDRFVAAAPIDPNAGVAGIREIRRLRADWDIRAVELFPAGTFPQVAINDPLMYSIYATCAELGIAVFCCAGVPGPGLRLAAQRVELIDEVMYDFPELTFVTRHGCEPWTDLAVKLMLKWPGLHYSTSNLAPERYPDDVIAFANTRGADKLIYAGYLPMGLSLERTMTELRNVGLRDHVWPRFLRDNALRVLGLAE